MGLSPIFFVQRAHVGRDGVTILFQFMQFSWFSLRVKKGRTRSRIRWLMAFWEVRYYPRASCRGFRQSGRQESPPPDTPDMSQGLSIQQTRKNG